MNKAAAQKSSWLNKTTIKYGTIAIVAIAIIIAVASQSRVSQVAQTPNPAASGLVAGSAAPPFQITSNAGAFDLATATTPVFLEVFATWCPHCQREVPVVNALAAKYAGKIQFLGVSGSPYGVDEKSPENQADIDAWVKALDVKYPIAFDPDLKVANQYLQGGYPTIVVIDSAKKVHYVGSGELPPATLQKAIDGVLSSKS
jgi:cytochrome c biogenesis protein CcmG/thiol:disulfide interchange protein DsbE